jgi:uncharacterized membrane protein YkoI
VSLGARILIGFSSAPASPSEIIDPRGSARVRESPHPSHRRRNLMRRTTALVGAAVAAFGLIHAAAVAGAGQEKAAWKGTIRVDFARVARRARVSMADAEKAALASLGDDAANAKVLGKEMETENDALVYEIKVDLGGKKREIQVDAGTGKVLGPHDHGSIRLGLARLAKVSKADAEAAALAAVEGEAADKTLGDSELEIEHDYLIYEIDVKVKGKPGAWEVIVDAGSGKVLASKHEEEGED